MCISIKARRLSLGHRLIFAAERGAPILLVEACDGETIGRVDLGTSDLNLRVMEIALLPVDAQ